MATAFLDHPIIVVAPFLIYFTEVKDIIFIGSFVKEGLIYDDLQM